MELLFMEISKYGMLFSFLLFTITGFLSIGRNKGALFILQRIFFFFLIGIAYMTMFMHTREDKYLFFFFIQVAFFALLFILYDLFYKDMSKLIVNNMCMLLAIGLVMISRITFDRAVKQFFITMFACAVCLFIPFLLKKLKWLANGCWLYAIFGIVFLGAMKIAGIITYGASISFTVANVTIQPVEFVKIIFVFFLASYLRKRNDFRSVITVSIVSGVHILLLVWSRELGGALIFFVVYLSLVYIATKKPSYFIGGMFGGGAAAFIAYHLFRHVRVRVQTWSTPFSVLRNDTSQISQSLFAIGTGSWFGLGLMEGIPNTIPVASEDFIFSAITEELGLFFSLVLLLVCLCTFIMFINIATTISDPFYKLLATGLGICYIFQVLLTVGGGTKFIPLTGVTLPLVSYGGSSVFCSLIMFHIIQGIYIMKKEEKRTQKESDEYYEDDDILEFPEDSF